MSQALATIPTSLRRLVRETDARQSPLSYAMRRIPGGRKAVVALLRLSEDERAVAFIETFDRGGYGDKNRIEDVVEACGLSPKDFIELFAGVAYDYNISIGHTIAAMAYPKIMATSVKRALQINGTDERKMHFQRTGFVPTPRGIQIGIKNTNVQSGDDETPGTPQAFAKTARTVVRDLPPLK